MKKIFLSMIVLAASTALLSAQNVQAPQLPVSYETTGNLSKKESGSCVAIKVGTDVKSAMNLMQNLLKSEGQKGSKSGNALIYTKAVFPTLSTDYINLSIAFAAASKDKNEPVTTVMCFVTKGISPDFINSSSDPTLIANLKNFLDQKYATQVYNNDVQMRLDAKNKEIKQTNTDLSNLQKTIEQRTKDISGYNNDIQKANNNIKKANGDIETAKKTIEVKKTLLQKQQDELKQIK